IVVHLYGGACEMDKILKITKKYKLKLIEDCAQATGTKYKNRMVGTFGDIGCFSFYPTKNLGAFGDGGMIITSNKKMVDKCMALRMYGMKNNYYSKMEGYNSRLDEIQASILNIKLKYIENWNQKRKEIANIYIKNIKNKYIILPKIRPDSKHVFHLFVIKTPYRKKLIEHLSKNDIGFGIHYPYPIHLQTGYSFLKKQSKYLKITEKTAKEIISLPIFPELQNKEIEYIVKTLNSFSPSKKSNT
ncbi:MAG: DegT/DnrJ/EryC1/StrS family aminotransferase, partial [Minisyncoccia bacterium]